MQACGSGGTTAGIRLGCHLAGLGLRVHAMAVCDDEAYFYNYVRLGCSLTGWALAVGGTWHQVHGWWLLCPAMPAAAHGAVGLQISAWPSMAVF